MSAQSFNRAVVLCIALLASAATRAQTNQAIDGPETAPQSGNAESGAGPEPSTAESPPAAGTNGGGGVPPVEIVQPNQPTKKKIQQVTKKEKSRTPPRAVPEASASRPVAEPAVTEFEPAAPNLIAQPQPGYYGPPGGGGAHERAMHSSENPINPLDGIVPGSFQDFSSAASRVSREKIDEQEPLTTNDILQTVPGVNIMNDDGLGVHGGIGVRGAPPRRTRKTLLMEDGRSINQSLWLDPSSEYVPPSDRIEQVEVLRGTVIAYGPNNNYGVVNFRNLSPFGPDETKISGSGGLGYDAGKWHAHTRQTAENWGAVFSYSGANAEGAWDTERLRYNDFYAALGWKGIKSDITFSAVNFRQQDNYDETNFRGSEKEFFRDIQHCKTCFNPGSALDTYNADIVLLQGVYNYYIDPDTTVSTRVYGQLMDRFRYDNFDGANPLAADTSFAPFVKGGDVFVPEGVMQGRLRTYDNIGTELRTEFANRPFLFGLQQDLQVGVRYEHHDFIDHNIFGRQGPILDDFDSKGLTIFERKHKADAVSAFLQTDIPLTSALSVVPGARLDHYFISRDTLVQTGGSEERDSCAEFDGQPCDVVGGFDDDAFTEAVNRTHVLPGVAFAYGFGRKEPRVDRDPKSLGAAATEPTYSSTLYGGYHRGLTMGVLRTATFPPGDELGHNYQIGLRSVALPGLTFDMAGFHQNIQEYQSRTSATTSTGLNVYTLIDEVHINGFEAYARLDSRPLTGWKLNPYAEGSFTLADAKIESGVSSADGASVAGNFVPAVPHESAYLTAGIESAAGWNASVSWSYRGAFFTDEDNTPFGSDPDGDTGEVPGVWLLAARANYKIPDTNAEIFISGENLADKLYITDRDNGIKPGIGRTVMLGSKLKW